MGNLTITLPDSSTLQVPEGRTAFEAIGAISPRLQKAALAVAIDGVLADCSRVLDRDAALRVITFDSPEGKDVLWHSASHLRRPAHGARRRSSTAPRNTISET